MHHEKIHSLYFLASMKGKYWATVRIPALGTYRVRRSDVNPANIALHTWRMYSSQSKPAGAVLLRPGVCRAPEM